LWKPWRLSSPNGAWGTKPSGVYVQLLKSLRIIIIQGLSTGVSTSGFRNATGQTGTVGSILETAITLAPGEKFSFDWAFLGNDLTPYNDFALFYLKGGKSRAIVFSNLLAQIGSPKVPIAAILLLLDVGSF
jgi:hypothetical protein